MAFAQLVAVLTTAFAGFLPGAAALQHNLAQVPAASPPAKAPLPAASPLLESSGGAPLPPGATVFGPNQNVLTVPLGDSDLNRRLEALALQLAATEPTRVISNRGGWQSDKSLHRRGFPVFDELMRQMQAPVMGLLGLPSWKRGGSAPAGTVGAPTLQVNELWVNVVNAGGEAVWHNHVRGRSPGQIVGVYYVATGNSGPSRLRLREGPDEKNVFEVEPERGLVAFLPAQMEHAVDKHRNVTGEPEGPRISVAFNLVPRWFSSPAHRAVYDGDLGAVERFIAGLTEKDLNSWDLIDNSRDGAGRTLLHTAVEAGHVPIAARLLDLRADVYATSLKSQGVLHYVSVAAGDTSTLAATLLAARGSAHINRPAPGGWQPLHHAVVHGSDQLVGLLLEERAEPNARSKSGQEPLHMAAAGGRGEVAARLLEHRADLRAVDGEGREPIHRAAEDGHLGLVELLAGRDRGLPWAPVKEWAMDGRRKVKCENAGDLPIHLAANRGYLPLVAALGGLGGMLNTTGAEGRGLLHAAARRSHSSVVAWLIERRVDVRAKDASGQEPLHVAAEKGHARVVQLLLDAGADPYRVNANGTRAIDLATMGGEAARVLREHCAARSAAEPAGRLRGLIQAYALSTRGCAGADSPRTDFV